MQSGIKLISRIYLKLILLQVAVGTLLRIVLLFNEQTSDISFTFGQWLKIFLLGAVNAGAPLRSDSPYCGSSP